MERNCMLIALGSNTLIQFTHHKGDQHHPTRKGNISHISICSSCRRDQQQQPFLFSIYSVISFLWTGPWALLHSGRICIASDEKRPERVRKSQHGSCSCSEGTI